MTILGARAFAPDLAALWTDSQCLNWSNGQHSRTRNKLVVSGAGVACIAGGWDSLATEADVVVCMARDLDHAARILPERLRQRCMKIIRGEGRDPRDVARQVILLAGWSVQWSRVVVYRLSGPAFFEPVLTTAECQPEVPEFFRLGEPHPEHVTRIARAQMDALRADYPAATGGILTMATIRPGAITVSRPCDLGADAEQPWMPTLLEVSAVVEEVTP